MPSLPYSTALAVQLGKLVLSAYDLYDQNDPAGFAPPPGYTLLSKVYADDITDDSADYEVFGFVARCGGEVVVAIRGTDGWLNWVSNVEFALVPCAMAGAGRTEAGFTDLYATFRTGPSDAAPRVVDFLRQQVAAGGVSAVRITGHSLGAALATLLALDFAQTAPAGAVAPEVYTFASPLVGDKEFAATYDRLVETSWRIANANDIVPKVPPSFAGYAHVDAEVPINSDDRSRHTLVCWHSLDTYLNTLDPTQPLAPDCAP